jgi:DNA-binding transcriptional ArsR family regulator
MEIYEAVNTLSALAQEARLAVFRLLVEAGPEGMPVGDIGAALTIPPATLSFHLVQLKHAGLVAAERRGRQLIHVARFERMNELVSYLTENCCGGAPCDVTQTRCAPPRRKALPQKKIRKSR